MIVIILTFALLIGSFLNVCIYRIPRKESISFPPSHCPNCNKNLKPVDLFPVLSYVFLRGKCRYCSNKISMQYPIIEATNGALWVILYSFFGLSIEFYGYAALSSLLLVISMIDFETEEIPDSLNIFALITGIIFVIAKLNVNHAISSVIGLMIGAGVFFIIALVTNGAMGGGDIKLMGALGFWFGWKLTIALIILSFVVGAVASLFLLLFKSKKKKDFIPFGPFIAISAYIVMIFGNYVIEWYLNLLLL